MLERFEKENEYRAIVYRFIGVKQKNSNDVWQPYLNAKNVFYKKVIIALSKPSSRVEQRKNTPGRINFDYYKFAGEQIDCVGKIILKIVDDIRISWR